MAAAAQQSGFTHLRYAIANYDLLVFICGQAHHAILAGCGHAANAAFGRSHTVGDRSVREMRFDRLFQMTGEHRPAAAKAHHMIKLPPTRIGVERIVKRPRHSIAHDLNDVDLVFLDPIPDRFGIEAAHGVENQCQPAEQARPRSPNCCAMHQRCDGEHLELIAFACTARDFIRGSDRPAWVKMAPAAKAGKEEGLMRPHYTLGHTRGPAGVLQQDVVL